MTEEESGKYFVRCHCGYYLGDSTDYDTAVKLSKIPHKYIGAIVSSFLFERICDLNAYTIEFSPSGEKPITKFIVYTPSFRAFVYGVVSAVALVSIFILFPV